MHELIKKGFALICVFALVFSLSAKAKPTVVVSVEPLYDIVEALMLGVDKPVVLLQKEQLQQNLSSGQIKQLLTADMIIRVGDGLEQQLGKSLKNELKIVSNYTLTLSNYMPLLKKSNLLTKNHQMLLNRQENNDLRFWMDPKLLAMATRYITPQLVRMDPEHQEQYLENELVLLEKIRLSAKKTQQEISRMSEQEKNNLAMVNPYFAHRFIFTDEVLDRHEYIASIQKTQGKHCWIGQSTQFSKLTLESDNIQANLQQLLSSANACVSKQLAVYNL